MKFVYLMVAYLLVAAPAMGAEKFGNVKSSCERMRSNGKVCIAGEKLGFCNFPLGKGKENQGTCIAPLEDCGANDLGKPCMGAGQEGLGICVTQGLVSERNRNSKRYICGSFDGAGKLITSRSHLEKNCDDASSQGHPCISDGRLGLCKFESLSGSSGGGSCEVPTHFCSRQREGEICINSDTNKLGRCGKRKGAEPNLLCLTNTVEQKIRPRQSTDPESFEPDHEEVPDGGSTVY